MSTSSENKAIGHRLQEIRERKGLSQQAFADSLRVSLRTYQNYERGARAVSKDLMCALMEQYDIAPLWLLTGKKTSQKIDLAIFKEIQQALQSEQSELKGLTAEEFSAYVATIYNEVASIDDREVQRRMITAFMTIASQSKLKEFIRLSEWLIPRWETLPPELRQFPGFGNVEHLTKDDLRKEQERAMQRLEELDAFLKSLSAQGINATQKDSATTEPDASHAETPSRQKNIKDRGHKVAAIRGTARGVRKRKR
jgi:transcriptional regulator with XRE-family HTH domain